MASSAFGVLLRGIRVAVKIFIGKVDLQDSKSDGGTAGVLAQFARMAVRVEYHRRAPGPLRACPRGQPALGLARGMSVNKKSRSKPLRLLELVCRQTSRRR